MVATGEWDKNCGEKTHFLKGQWGGGYCTTALADWDGLADEKLGTSAEAEEGTTDNREYSRSRREDKGPKKWKFSLLVNGFLIGPWQTKRFLSRVYCRVDPYECWKFANF